MADLRVLLVDDEPLLLQTYERSLRRRFTVEVADGPREGLARLAEFDYAVVVADMFMPGMTGLQVLERVHQTSKTTVGVLLTGMGDYEQALAAINQGIVYRFLTKPCALEMLIRSIQDSVEYHRLLTQKDSLQPMLRALACHQARVRPEIFSLGTLVRRLAESLQLPSPEDFETAANLCFLAQSHEQALYQSLADLTPLAEVLEMASLPSEPWSQRLPQDLRLGARAAVGAHLLDLARHCARSHQQGYSPSQTLHQLSPEHYHPAALASLAQLTA